MNNNSSDTGKVNKSDSTDIKITIFMCLVTGFSCVFTS